MGSRWKRGSEQHCFIFLLGLGLMLQEDGLLGEFQNYPCFSRIVFSVDLLPTKIPV